MTTQTSVRTQDPKLSRNYGTNDRMLHYKRIQDYFFMDTFFATKKGERSSRGHTCCQLFVTDKGFLYVVPMRRKSEVLHAIKQFAKEIGAPTSIIADMFGEQISHNVWKFCNGIGTTLQALEEDTPWSNKAELYIGLCKEAVRKDMHKSNSPMVLWDYCVERPPGSTTSRQKTTSSYMGQHPILQPWLRRVISHPSVNSVGMSGVIIVKKQLLSPIIVKYLEESRALPMVRATRWPNGYSKPMGR